MLEQIAHFNDFSPSLRKKLEAKVKAYGTKVKYKFNISSENPDPEKYNGRIIWPARYVLDPIVFNIIDHEEERENKSRSKRVGLVDTTDEKGIPNKFKRVRIHGKDEGVKTLDLTKPDEFAEAMYIELHPKLNGGLFQDKEKNPVISIIDDQKAAKEARTLRREKAKAREKAEALSDKDAKQFAAGMNWDEDEDMEILRNKIELLAEDDPVFFNKLFVDKRIEYQATVKRAIVNKVISYDPIGGKMLWASNQQIITVLGLGDGTKNEIERFAEYLLTGGAKADELYGKIKAQAKS